MSQEPARDGVDALELAWTLVETATAGAGRDLWLTSHGGCEEPQRTDTFKEHRQLQTTRPKLAETGKSQEPRRRGWAPGEAAVAGAGAGRELRADRMTTVLREER